VASASWTKTEETKTEHRKRVRTTFAIDNIMISLIILEKVEVDEEFWC